MVAVRMVLKRAEREVCRLSRCEGGFGVGSMLEVPLVTVFIKII